MKVTSFVALVVGLASHCFAAGASEIAANATWPAPRAISSWNGFYAGAHFGVDNSATDWDSVSGFLSDYGFLPFAGTGLGGGARFGGQVGYNFQRGAFVFGVEADASFGATTGYARCALGYFYCSTKIKDVGTFAGRVGAVTGNFLWYGKAGLGWTHIDRNMTSGSYFNVFDGYETRTGFLIGAGAEYAFTPSWSGKIEYNHIDFGRKSLTFTDQFANVTDALVGQNLDLIKVGLNYHLGTSPTLDDGAPVVAAALPQWNWTGFYGGVHVGGALGRNEWISATGNLDAESSSSGFPGQGNTEGLFAGGQIGINIQSGAWVAGLELAASASDIDGYAKCAQYTPGGVSYACHNKISSISTVAGRIGQAWGNVLIYGKGGAVWGKQASEAESSFSSNSLYGESATRLGWMAGFGLEYAFSRNLSAFVEYNHLDFGTRTADYFSQSGGPSSVAFNQRIDLVKLGVNYRLGWGAPAREANAADPALFLKTAQVPAGWTIEAGARYFGSTGRMQKDLYDPITSARLNSRLIYGDQSAHAAETFFRFDHASGAFVKGNLGLGDLVSGSLNDEDFPAAINYSNTVSTMKNGRTVYGSADVGYNIINMPDGRLGGYVGYHSIYNRSNGYGCNQIATDVICLPGDIPSGSIVLSETESWRGIAVGLSTQMQLAERFRLEVDAAYLPYLTREGADNHWFRSDINPLIEPGRGWGTQIEAILSYAVSERLSVGFGGRYQFLTTTDASTQFPGSANASPLKHYAERFGGFLQTSYKFGDVEVHETKRQGVYKAPPLAPAVNWTGSYIGGSIGSGLGRSRYADPFPAPVAGDYADLGGAFGGGQVGINYQTGRFVFGAEVAANWADIEGTNTCFGNFPNATIAGFNCGSRIEAIGSVAARAGYAFGRALIYAKGGVAWDRQEDQFNTTGVGGSIITGTGTNWGWTAGAGIEYALPSNWSVGLEYKYYEFGKSNAFTTNVLPDLTGVNLAPDHVRLQTFMMNVNYRFSPSALIARN